MCPQKACLRRCIVTLVTFVWFFSTVRFQMCPQIACPWGCIVTLVAFVGLFSTVRFQMCPQSTCIRGCILTLAAIIWFVSTVHFHICLQMSNVSLMNVQVSFLCKTFSTLIAQEGTHRLSMSDLNAKSSFSDPNCFECKMPQKLIGGVNAIQKMI